MIFLKGMRWCANDLNKENMTQPFAICINNEGYEASLEVGKVYCIIPDTEASAHGYIRVIDESGEDYAFDDHRFHRVDLPDAVGEMLASAQQV